MSRESMLAPPAMGLSSLVLSSLALSAIDLAATVPATAADVTFERLRNAPAEPQNWLMVHHDYGNSRHSSLAEINRETVKDLKLKFVFSIGGRSTGGTLRGKEEATPLVDDGFHVRHR
jgi:alcohol dehydrogenase (cytochrome c)